MGSCLCVNIVRNELPNKFLKYNVIDKKYNIIVGTYFNKDKSKKKNIIINQGICIGNNNNKISKIKFGIIHRHTNKMVELYFENNIKLIIIRENINQLKMMLSFDHTFINKYIDYNTIKEYKLINNNSEYIDLICDLINE